MNYMLQPSEFHIISSRVLRLNPISNTPCLHSFQNAKTNQLSSSAARSIMLVAPRVNRVPS